MKNKQKPQKIKGAISLTIDPKDTIAWKCLMLFEAATSTDKTIKEIAHKYGYSREYFYIVKEQFELGGAKALEGKNKGPKGNHKRSDEVVKQIILHRFLDPEANCEVITQKMNQSGIDISQRSVERTINEYGLQKKGYIKQIKNRAKRK